MKLSKCVCGCIPAKYRSDDGYCIECCNSQCADGGNKVVGDNPREVPARWNKFISLRCMDLGISYKELKDGNK